MQERKEELQVAVGNTIKNCRKHISISQISNEIGLSKSIWSDLEKGQKDIQLSTFWRIAEGLDIKPSELLKLVENSLNESFSFLENCP